MPLATLMRSYKRWVFGHAKFISLTCKHCVKRFHSLLGRWAFSQRQTSVSHVRLNQHRTASTLLSRIYRNIPLRNKRSWRKYFFLWICISAYHAWRSFTVRITSICSYESYRVKTNHWPVKWRLSYWPVYLCYQSWNWWTPSPSKSLYTQHSWHISGQLDAIYIMLFRERR